MSDQFYVTRSQSNRLSRDTWIPRIQWISNENIKNITTQSDETLGLRPCAVKFGNQGNYAVIQPFIHYEFDDDYAHFYMGLYNSDGSLNQTYQKILNEGSDSHPLHWCYARSFLGCSVSNDLNTIIISTTQCWISSSLYRSFGKVINFNDFMNQIPSLIDKEKSFDYSTAVIRSAQHNHHLMSAKQDNTGFLTMATRYTLPSATNTNAQEYSLIDMNNLAATTNSQFDSSSRKSLTAASIPDFLNSGHYMVIGEVIKDNSDISNIKYKMELRCYDLDNVRTGNNYIDGQINATDFPYITAVKLKTLNVWAVCGIDSIVSTNDNTKYQNMLHCNLIDSQCNKLLSEDLLINQELLMSHKIFPSTAPFIIEIDESSNDPSQSILFIYGSNINTYAWGLTIKVLYLQNTYQMILDIPTFRTNDFNCPVILDGGDQTENLAENQVFSPAKPISFGNNVILSGNCVYSNTFVQSSFTYEMHAPPLVSLDNKIKNMFFIFVFLCSFVWVHSIIPTYVCMYLTFLI